MNFAEDLHADLIIMGRKGRGKSNSPFGSTTTTMMRISDVPVFVIPEHVVFKPINTITFASDFDADKPMGNHIFFQELVEKYNSFIQILKVQKNEYAMTSENVSGKMETDLLLSKLRHRFFVIENKDVERGIHEFLASNPTDILVMVAHKHSLLKRIFGTVHTKEMSYQTKIPLLILQDE
ncbi:MAG: universal stress protein [Ginsengibacter sp.]